jgi:hypothetical protein
MAIFKHEVTAGSVHNEIRYVLICSGRKLRHRLITVQMRMVPAQTNSTSAIAHRLHILVVISICTFALTIRTAIQPTLQAVDATSGGKNTLMLKERTESWIDSYLLLSGWQCA